MWGRLETLVASAPSVRALRFHRLELLEARRRRAAGLALPPELRDDVAGATLVELAVPAVLRRARAAYDGRLVLMKGPEVALDYPETRLRRFRDLDLLVDDPRAAQAALVAAGFHEVGDPALFADIHHLRPLCWPGLPLLIELHSRAKWPAGVPGPHASELLASAVPSRTGIAGVETLPPGHHALVMAAHAWAHEPLARIGHLLDVAVTLERAEPGEAASLARAWGCSRMWRCTEAAVAATLHGERTRAAVGIWARHLLGVRERTVLELHLQRWLAPAWGLPPRAVPGGIVAAVRDDLRLDADQRRRAKLARMRLAVIRAGVPRPDHEHALERQGHRAPARH